MAISGAGSVPAEGGQGAETGVPAEGGQGAEQTFDFENAYGQLRPEYTRATQELASTNERLSEYEQLFEALQDPETAPEILQRLGFELDTGAQQGGQRTDADLSEWEDPLEKEIQELRGTVDELRSQSELEAEAKEEANLIKLRDDYIGEAIGYIEQETQQKFSEEDEEVLGNLAIAMEREDGVPDVQGAYNALLGREGFLERHFSNRVQHKGGAAQAPSGRTAPAEKKPQTPRERAQYFDQRLADIEAGEY